jgi:hypothetical protein
MERGREREIDRDKEREKNTAREIEKGFFVAFNVSYQMPM